MLLVASPNMVGSKLGLRMTTLHEETSNVGNQASTPINDDDEEKSDADYSEYDAYQVAYTPVYLDFKESKKNRKVSSTQWNHTAIGLTLFFFVSPPVDTNLTDSIASR